ncbi:hypothetical protein NEMBOFW57_002792 [Staphylotrichum longicolle]|uniref:Uncharacterized protein n=1 Tax=Staphylotrichum longicolle TaxID=669026 RepID=A0AAD4F406_9PEZI|nr:hypothetical protein NEMBOFW57_002792 [Staphylotrichum longicolle]
MTLPSESEFPDQEPPSEQKEKKTVWNRVKQCLEFRVSALKLEVHEHYKPLWPSPLRAVTAASDLPDPEPSDDAIVDDAPLNSPAASDTFSWGTRYLSSRRDATPEEWEEAGCDEDMAVKPDGPDNQEGTTDEAGRAG